MKHVTFFRVLIAVALGLASCSQMEGRTYVKKVTVIDYEPTRAPNSLQDYEVLWKARLSDSSVITLRREPQIGDTFEYRYIVPARQ